MKFRNFVFLAFIALIILIVASPFFLRSPRYVQTDIPVSSHGFSGVFHGDGVSTVYLLVSLKESSEKLDGCRFVVTNEETGFDYRGDIAMADWHDCNWAPANIGPRRDMYYRMNDLTDVVGNFTIDVSIPDNQRGGVIGMRVHAASPKWKSEN